MRYAIKKRLWDLGDMLPSWVRWLVAALVTVTLPVWILPLAVFKLIEAMYDEIWN